ncbi:MAG TPA: triose-phosphate isomerase [Xanthobacteraceae bacterium]|nr:triose-phosphate isomerase [Xanthobacteraceae bacterium]
MISRRPLVAGNWKMHGLQNSAGELTKIIAGAERLADVELMVCPPATLLASFAAAARGSRVLIGGQDCHAKPSGAYTGDISAEMLKDAGAAAVIVGHSERRQYYGETDEDVRAKARAGHRAGLLPIICIGETRAQREAGQALTVVRAQLDRSVPEDLTELVIAYEPVWAIGTGLTPTPPDIGQVHGAIREWLGRRADVRVLYGGSVNAANAKGLLKAENVDGALVGSASLKADELLAIAEVYR